MVSEAKVEYLFHKDVLVKSCPFFAKCLAANMKETLSNVVEMPDDSCGAFNLLAMYLYNEQIPDLKRGIEVRENNEAWTLVDKLGMPGFQDLLMNKLMQYCGQFSYTQFGFPGRLTNACRIPSFSNSCGINFCAK